MGRKGKAPKAAPAPPAQVDMTFEARRERLLGLGLSPAEVESHLAVTADCTTPDRLALTPEEATIAKDIARLTAMAPTTLCNHARRDGKRCLDCGGPVFGSDTKSAEAEARQSEKRFEPESLLTPEEREAPVAIVMTEGQLAAALDDGPSHEPVDFPGMVEIKTLWLDRADVLAKKRGMVTPVYLEWLIKRDWIASGGRGQ
jgi:hypothetical protein